jgi:hypothetical protein
MLKHELQTHLHRSASCISKFTTADENRRVIPLPGGEAAAGGRGGFVGLNPPTPALTTAVVRATPPKEGIFIEEVVHDVFNFTTADENAGRPRSVGAAVATGDGGHPRDPPPKPAFS